MKKLLLILAVLSTASLFIGAANLNLRQLLQGDPFALELLFSSRLPRLLAILLAGAGLSIAGLVMQQISQNRFAAPSTTGTIECAMLGYVLSLVFFGEFSQLGFVFSCAIIGTLGFIYLIQRIHFKNMVFVPLIGIIFGNVVEALTTFLAYKYDVLQSLNTWTVANFSHILRGDFELLFIAVPMVLLSYVFATWISATAMGKEFAINLGLNYHQILTLGVILVAIMSASVVMIVGQLPFLGLVIPNLVSLFYGDNLKKNIPLTAIYGALLVLSCDLISRIIIFPYDMPIAIIMSILAGGVFIFLLLRDNNKDKPYA